MGDAVQLDDVFPEGTGYLRCVEGVAERDKVRVLGEPVNDDHDCVISF